MSSFVHPTLGTIHDSRLIIFDTTLRDGEQAPGFSMNLDEKLRMAEALSVLGIDVMESGFPAASKGDFLAVQAIARQNFGPIICALARALDKDIECAGEALASAEKKRINIFLGTSPLHRTYKLNMQKEDVLALMTRAITKARQFTDDVEFSAEDALRTEPDFLQLCAENAIKAGATTINFPDTVGYSVPHEIGALFHKIVTEAEGADKAIFSTHNHNDMGLAVANSLFAIQNGAKQAECTINGIGERAGNTSLEELVVLLKIRKDICTKETSIITEKILKTSQLLASITGQDVQPNKAIVGRNAFAHEAGVHQDGLLKNRLTYEIISPELVGWKKTNFVLGKHSGRAAFQDKVTSMGYIFKDEDNLNIAFAKLKDLFDTHKHLSDERFLDFIKHQSGVVQAKEPQIA